MRTFLILILSLILTIPAYSQVPQSFQYQAVVRDAIGNAISNHSVSFRTSIISGSPTGTYEYVETHNTFTNQFGVVNLSIGTGNVISGNFSTISWGAQPHYIKIETDSSGGTNYLDMGTTQLLSTPYALYAEQSGNLSSLWSLNGNNMYNTNSGNVGVGINNPLGRMVVQGDPNAQNTDPLFEVKNAAGQTIFVVYPDSVHIYVKDDGAKANQGGFAVSGRNNAKAITNNFLTVTPDSTRIFTGDTLSGFGVENIGASSSTSYMHVTPANYFIGHQAGMSNTSGIYNSFLGYQAGKFNTQGFGNIFIGHQSGLNNVSGNENTAIGMYSLNSNTNGNWNTATGARSLNSNLSGIENVATGDYTLYLNTTGSGNSAFGSMALYRNVSGSNNSGFGRYVLWFNSTGENNSAFGSRALYNNLSGNNNIAIGFESLFNNTIGSFNTAIGTNTLRNNINGVQNVANGYMALFNNTTGSYNTVSGYMSLYNNTIGEYNTANGTLALFNNTTGIQNVAMGSNSLFNNLIGSFNNASGYYSLYNNTSGSSNTAYGLQSLFTNKTGSNNCSFGNGAYFFLDSLSNTTCIGYWSGGIVNASNRVEVGNASINWIGGQVAWSTYSDERIKDNIKEDVPGLDFINLLRPVTYNLNIHRQNEMNKKTEPKDASWTGKYDIEKIRMTGFLAQDVYNAAKKIGYDFSGVEQPKDESELYSIRYSDFTVPLVKAVQEQQKQIEELNSRIKELESIIINSQK